MMSRPWLAAAASAALLGVLAACATAAPAPPATIAATPGPSAAEAEAFVQRADQELAALSEASARADWARATNITYDTNWIAAKANAAFTERAVQLAMEAARYDAVQGLSPDAARMLKLLKQGLTLPAPAKPGAAAELAQISADLEEIYATGKFQHAGKTLTLNDAEQILAKSRDPAVTKAVWEGWATISPPMAEKYTRLVAIANEGARGLGYADTGALWRSKYEMSPDAFAAETDRLWAQVKPLYDQLHCHVRAKLSARYGAGVQPPTGPIRADLLGNMWAQSWENIEDIVKPRTPGAGYDLTQRLKANKYDPIKMVKTGEGFFTSLGFEPLPETFWERSMITRPRDREVVCHASAWDLDNRDDLRIKMCTTVTGEDFNTVHHELGHNFYQRAYKDQPFLYKDGANDGFHEAIGDLMTLSITPAYLERIGLIAKAPGPEGDTALLMSRALEKVAFLPFGLLVDRWRWQVFSGQTTPATYNQDWWTLRTRYQGVAPPGPRPAGAFDPGAKYHVPASVPYTRYFLAHILQFQFYRAACQQAGWTGPLHRCTLYGDKTVGAKFDAMLRMGASKPWPDALEAFTGQREIDASAVVDYFRPLMTYLESENKSRACGW